MREKPEGKDLLLDDYLTEEEDKAGTQSAINCRQAGRQAKAVGTMDGRMRRGRKRKKALTVAKEASRPGKKTGTGLGRVGVGVGPLFQNAVLQEAGLCTVWLLY